MNKTKEIQINQYSYGGCDITAIVDGEILGTLQAISYSVSREKGPIYVMGKTDPIAFARGKRAVAGSLIFITLEEQSLRKHIRNSSGGDKTKFYSNKSEVRYEYQNENSNDFAALFNQAENEPLNYAGDERQLAEAWYVDQILPFDVNVSAANEVGSVSKMSIYGIDILNEGSGVSVDDLVIEEQYTYLARGMSSLSRVFGVGRTN